MMKINKFIMIFLAAIIHINCLSAGMISDARIGTSINFISVSGLWEISFPDGYLTDGTPVDGVSVLDYDSIKNTSLCLHFSFYLYEVLRCELGFRPKWISFNNSKGEITDTDKLTAPEYSPYIFSESKSKGHNDSTQFEIQFLYQISEILFPDSDEIISTFILIGYMKNIELITATSGVQTLSDNSMFNEDIIPPVGSIFSGLESTYEFNWDTISLGINSEADFMEKTFQIRIFFAFLLNFYKGEGYWNLRTYSATHDPEAWRDLSPNFIHYKASGLGVLFGGQISYKLSKEIKVF